MLSVFDDKPYQWALCEHWRLEWSALRTHMSPTTQFKHGNCEFTHGLVEDMSGAEHAVVPEFLAVQQLVVHMQGTQETRLLEIRVPLSLKLVQTGALDTWPISLVKAYLR